MKRKIILAIILAILIVLVSFVSADMVLLMEGEDTSKYKVDVSLVEGWNLVLVPEGFGQEISSRSEIQGENVLAAYLYIPDSKSYSLIYPDESEYSHTSKRSLRLDISPAWIYSDKNGYFEYTAIIPNYDEVTLSEGWTFFTITPDILGKKLKEIKGNCDIIELSRWSSFSQSWISIISPEKDAKAIENLYDLYSFSSGDEGMGFLIKVSGPCRLGEANREVPNPPALPGN